MNTNALWDSLQSTLGSHIPQLLGALAIFVLGWLIAVVVIRPDAIMTPPRTRARERGFILVSVNSWTIHPA